MKSEKIIVFVVFGIILSVYLFATAPPPLLVESNSNKKISVKDVLEILNNENKIVRSVYTKEIVIMGKKVGLKFDEKWQEDEIIAGPLPAQFLRETAKNLERRPVRLGLYLGSDYPINKANKLIGTQLEIFKNIKITKKDQFFHVNDMGIYVYMSADIAIANVCINCHNKHTQSPKDNWVLNDVMGATTWTYPEEKVSIENALLMIAEFQSSVKISYMRYLKHISSKNNPPLIGKKWPVEGYFLPSTTEFMKRVTTRSSSNTMSALVNLMNRADSVKGI